MSAAINPNQLRMFMTAGELRGMDSIDVAQRPDSRFGGAWRDLDDMWRTKRRENKWDRMDTSGGVNHPVTLAAGKDVDGVVIKDGHHRIEDASRRDPAQFVPVKHHNLDEGF